MEINKARLKGIFEAVGGHDAPAARIKRPPEATDQDLLLLYKLCRAHEEWEHDANTPPAEEREGFYHDYLTTWADERDSLIYYAVPVSILRILSSSPKKQHLEVLLRGIWHAAEFTKERVQLKVFSGTMNGRFDKSLWCLCDRLARAAAKVVDAPDFPLVMRILCWTMQPDIRVGEQFAKVIAAMGTSVLPDIVRIFRTPDLTAYVENWKSWDSNLVRSNYADFVTACLDIALDGIENGKAGVASSIYEDLESNDVWLRIRAYKALSRIRHESVLQKLVDTLPKAARFAIGKKKERTVELGCLRAAIRQFDLNLRSESHESIADDLFRERTLVERILGRRKWAIRLNELRASELFDELHFE